MAEIQSARERAVGSFVGGVGVHREAFHFLRQHGSLWGLAAIPFALSVVAFGAVGAGLLNYGGELYAWTSGVLPVIDAGVWYDWLWVGPLKFLLWTFGMLLFLGVVAISFLLGFLVANILASPFLDLLSQRVEDLATGRGEDEHGGVWESLKDASRTVIEELRRTGFFVLLQLLILMMGLVPGGQLVAVPCSILVAIVFLTLDMASYSLDRRRLSFADKRRWIASHRSSVMGYGTIAFVACMVPGLNWFAMPWFVTGGTLLVLRHPPTSDAGPPSVS